MFLRNIPELAGSVNSPQPSMSDQTRTPFEIVHAWIASTNNDFSPAGERIDKARSTSYIWIWSKWVKHIASTYPTTDLLEALSSASSVDVIRFIHSGIDAVKASSATSPVSKSRYFTTLDRIYSFMQTNGICDSNPVKAVTIADSPSQEISVGAAFDEATWQACINEIPNDASCTSAVEIRNRVILMLIFYYGLTPQEVRDIDCSDVAINLLGEMTLTISATRSKYQARAITLSREVASALLKWVDVRQGMKSIQTNFESKGCINYLFVTQKSSVLSTRSLLQIFKSHIECSCRKFGLETPIRMGPQIVRNTVVVRWLNHGTPVATVVSQAGLKNGKGLYHLLPHLNDAARQAVAPLNKHD